MSGAPAAEWMLWAKIFKDQYTGLQVHIKKEHDAIQTRIEALESACEALKQAVVQQETMCQSRAQYIKPNIRSVSEATTAGDTTARPAPHQEEAYTGRAVQGSLTLIEYLEREEVIIARQDSTFVMGFIDGMNSRHQRAELKDRLEGKVYIWQTLQNEVREMVKDAERRKKKRRSLELW